MLPAHGPAKAKEPPAKSIEGIQHTFGDAYQVVKEIGEGAYAKVFECIETKTGKKFAIKEFTNALTNPKLAQCCLREIEIVTQSKHENMVKLHSLACSGNSVYLVMDYMPTDLRKLVRSPTYFDHMEVKQIMYEILLAVNYLHSIRVVHRDVKPGNILFSMEEIGTSSKHKGKFQVKVCDFGLARSISGLKNCMDFDVVYRKEFAISNEQNGATEDSSDHTDEVLEDLDEHVMVNAARSIPGHFGLIGKTQSFKAKPHTLAVETFGLAKSKSSVESAYIRQGSDGTHDKEEVKHSSVVPVNVRRTQFFEESKPSPLIERELTSHIASRWYRAPEVILLEKTYSSSIDMWGVGCVFAELLQMINGNRAGYKERRPLFPGSSCFPLSPQLRPGSDNEIEHFSPGDQMITICKILGTPLGEEIGFVSDYGAKQYLQLLPKYEKKDWGEMFPECTMEELELLQKLLSFNPFQRITAKEALRHAYFKTVREKDRETEGAPIILEKGVEGEVAIIKLIQRCKKGV